MLKKVICLLLAVGFMFGLTMPASALAERSDSDDTPAMSASEHEDSATESKTSAARDTEKPSGENKLKTNVERRLKDAKLRVCKQRQSKISGIMSRNVVRPEKQLQLFNSVFQRVQDFYAKKGKISATYEDKVAAVNAAKVTAEADVKALSGLNKFDCTGSDPKGDGAAFKAALDKANDSLKAYRTALKDLIKDVKAAQGESEND